MSRRSRRPGIVTAAAVLTLIYSALSVMGGCCGLIWIGIKEEGGLFKDDPELAKFQKEVADQFDRELPSGNKVELANTVFSIPEGLVLLLGAVALLGMRPWGRRLVIAVALLAMVLSFSLGTYHVAYFGPAHQKAFQTAVDDLKKARQDAADEAAKKIAKEDAGKQPDQHKQDARELMDEDFETLEEFVRLQSVFTSVFYYFFAFYLAIIVVMLILPGVGRKFAAPALDDFGDLFDDRDDDRDSRRRDDDDRGRRSDDRRDDDRLR